MPSEQRKVEMRRHMFVLALVAGLVASAGTATAATTGGHLLAFASNRSGHFEIYLMKADDGSGLHRLTRTGGNRPAWSPDGARIAFDSGKHGPPVGANIYVINADGSGLTQLTDSAGGNFLADWSPDGSKIAFVSLRDGNPEIYVMDADGSHERRLTENTSTDSAPSWSPDGSHLAFHSDRSGNFEMWVIDADGSSPQQLTHTLDAVEGFADWSPDGSRITFDSDRDRLATDPGCFGNFDIFVMSSEGANQQNLTKDPSTNAWPDWSPDGSRIAFASDRSRTCNFEIYSMNTHGFALKRLTFNPAIDWFPAYQPE